VTTVTTFPRVSRSQVAESVGGLAQRIAPFHNRRHPSRLEKLLQEHQILVVNFVMKKSTFWLAPNEAVTMDLGSDRTVALGCSDHDEGRLRIEDANPSVRSGCGPRGGEPMTDPLVSLSALDARPINKDKLERPHGVRLGCPVGSSQRHTDVTPASHVRQAIAAPATQPRLSRFP
jgi:hypothetical protein